MQRTKIVFSLSLAVIVALGFMSNHTTANEPDPILESFERELDHEPAPAPRARREDIAGDELYKAVNSIHWTRSDQEDVDEKEFDKESMDTRADE